MLQENPEELTLKYCSRKSVFDTKTVFETIFHYVFKKVRKDVNMKVPLIAELPHARAPLLQKFVSNFW